MEKSVGRLVSILYRKNQVYLNTALKDLMLTASELPLVTYLSSHGGVSQEELSAFLLIDKAATARAVKSLISKGFIKKEKDPDDRRANKLFLTPSAQTQMPEITKRLRKWNGYLTENLDEGTADVMYQALESMVHKIDTIDFRMTWRAE